MACHMPSHNKRICRCVVSHLTYHGTATFVQSGCITLTHYRMLMIINTLGLKHCDVIPTIYSEPHHSSMENSDL